MSLTISELARARDTASELLERIGLEAYLFEVEPQDGDWLVRVECALESGWKSVTLKTPRDSLLGKESGDGLLAQWRERLAACKTSPS